jgi:hypothetical protein
LRQVSSRTFAIAALLLALLPAAAQAKLKAPALSQPPAGATVESVPTFTWGRVNNADHYEFQLSADSRFGSIALGKGAGRGSFSTRNLAATTSKSIPDGDYYWRVRAVSPNKAAGNWSATRHLVKAWRTPPILEAANPLDVSWPALPLVLRWSAVPHATTYQVVIATDESLSTPVVGSSTRPTETQGTSWALDAALPQGRQYFWAITPIDAEGHKGVRSAIGRFTWTWPTITNTRVTDLNPDPRVFDPQFSWDPIPGAARYEVEVNAAQGFPANSKWCCTDPTIGTSLSPTRVLANNTYYWRMRAVDVEGNFGDWNYGPSFEKSFDKVTPSIDNLRMIDVHGNTIPANPGAGDPAITDTPIIAWDPVPGAVKYEVQIGTFTGTWNAGGCSFDDGGVTSVPYFTVSTPGSGAGPIGPAAWPSPHGAFTESAGGDRYCVRIRAYSDEDAHNNDVISAAFTQMNGANHPAFQFDDSPAASPTPTTGALHTSASDYILPSGASLNTRTPLFTWNRVADADGYYVVVARDEDFSKIADIAYTETPAYAPRNFSGTSDDNPIPYLDETTSYYWVVIPYKATHTPQLDDLPETQHVGDLNPPRFDKNSTPPTPLAPVNGATVSTQLEFRWTTAEHARNYTLQVASDPTFSNVLDSITTDSTAYTSSSTYPTDTLLYWRVRANDVNKRAMRWSEEQPIVATFRRVLPAPSPSADNPTGGGDIPVLSWSPINGAVSYSLHVDQAGGTTKDFTLASTAFTPVVFYGTGIWRWKVRANFPTDSSQQVGGAYSNQVDFVRTLDAPSGVKGEKVGGRFVVSWDPDRIAKQYRVEISQSNSFERLVESTRTQNLSWAPTMTSRAFADGGTLYWRVAAVDSGGNVGAFKTGSFVLPKGLRISITGLLRHGRRSQVTITVRSARTSKAVRGARITITGAGIRTTRRSTNRRGIVMVSLTPGKAGTLTVSARRKGFRDAIGVTKVH